MVKLQEQKTVKILCMQRQREIDELAGKNIINTIFSRYYNDILEHYPVKGLYKVPTNLPFFKKCKTNCREKKY